MKDSKYVFSINEADIEKLKKFEKQHKKCNMGMAADKFSYTFCPTSLGMAITVECSCGQKLLLGNFLDHDESEYNEEEHRPLTEQDLMNQRFEEAALMILQLKDPRVFRIAFRSDQSFEIIHAYAEGLAVFADNRITEAILYKTMVGKNNSFIENYHGDDLENIKLFYDHFEKNIRKEIKKYDCTNQRLLDELYPRQKERRLKKMAREDNVAVFEDTEKLCKENGRLSEAVSTSLLNQQIILEKDTLGETLRDRYPDEAKLVVSMKRSYEAAKAYKGTRTAVHNFASATNPGGGVKKGSGAQEECLCRCSTLFFDLDTKDAWSKFYTPHRAAKDPIHNSDIIYTPGVIVFKTDTAYPLKMQEKDWYQVDVITCAAPNLKPNPTNQFNPGDGDKAVKVTDNELLAIHEKRLRRILDVAVLNGVESIVLGAFGCGAFKNKPEVVALAAKNVIKNYLHAFKNIEFAVYCRPNDDRNYKVFERTLRK